ncbi:MAG: CDP-alcohol phosphatidyltransferase family protein [Candidatus Norongarragalinales archaeon]
MEERPPRLRDKDFFSLASAALGLLAITVCLGLVSPYSAWLPFDVAASAILLAAAFDWLDGKIARAEHEANAFGRELDSLCDAVAFGVAPIAYVAWRAPSIVYAAAGFGLASLFFYWLAALVRLAWFNVQEDRTHYYGLIVPVAALFAVAAAMLFGANAWVALFAIGGLMLARFKWKKPM